MAPLELSPGNIRDTIEHRERIEVSPDKSERSFMSRKRKPKKINKKKYLKHMKG